MELDSDGTRYTYLWGPGRLPLSVTRERTGQASETFAYQVDAMGSVIGTTDESGTVVARYSYDPWGRLTDETAIGDEIAYRNPLRYRAYYQDAETGLYYMPARFYDPATYRFLSGDPAAPSAGDPGSLNRYAYCEDDPIQNIDPDGRELMGYMVSLYSKIWGDRDRAYAFAGSHRVGKWDYSPSRYRRLSNGVSGRSGLGRTQYRQSATTHLLGADADFQAWQKGVHEANFSAEVSTPVDEWTWRRSRDANNSHIAVETVGAALEITGLLCPPLQGAGLAYDAQVTLDTIDKRRNNDATSADVAVSAVQAIPGMSTAYLVIDLTALWGERRWGWDVPWAVPPTQ